MTNTRKITRTAFFITIALLLGYVESLFPPIVPIPGIKLGLANAVVVLLLYKNLPKTAWTVSLMKVILSSLLFGSMTSLIYSLFGAVLSLIVMIVSKKIKIFSILGVSSLGGIAHNLGQIICAYFFLGKGVLYYIPMLCLFGAVCGMLTGISAQIIIRRGNLFGKE